MADKFVEFLNCKFKIGEKLLVETQNEILIGNLKLISRNGHILELDNVRDFNTNYNYTSTQLLPKPTIKKIKKINQNESVNESETTTSSATDTSSSSSSEQYTTTKSSNMFEIKNGHGIESKFNDLSIMPLSDVKLRKIDNLLESCHFIFQTDRSYYSAIEDLRTQSIISLYIESTELGRHSKTSLIAIATQDQVYIFDLIFFGKILKEFKEIIENDWPKKIIHYSHKISDHLKNLHEINIKGIFDTFVAHCMISKNQELMDLTKCIERYLKIPEQYFEARTNEPLKDSCIRPLSEEIIKIVSKKTIFLYKLYEHFLHRHMLSNFYAQCNNFEKVFTSDKDNVGVAMLLGPKSTHGLDRIDVTSGWNDLLDNH